MIKKFVWNYLERILSKLDVYMDKLGRISRESRTFRVITYQLEFRPFETVERIIDFVESRMKDVSKFSPSVLIFPGFFGDSFFGLVPFSSGKLKTDRGMGVIKVYSSLVKGAFVRFLRKLSYLSGSVVIGGIVVADGKEEVAISHPNGQVSIFSSDNKSRIFHVSGVKCAFLFPDETLDHRLVRALSEEGVRVFFTTESLKGDYSEWEMRRGIWARSQSIGIYGVNSSSNGEFLGERYTGISFVSAPAVLTKNLDGFLAKLNSPSGSGMVVADLDLDSLENFIDSLPKTYRKYRSFV